MIRRSHAFPATAAALAACAALNVAPAVAQAPPIEIQSRAEQWLLAGSLDDPYWVIDNRWGQGSIPGGAFSQGVGGGSSADGRVAFRMQWQWPQGDTEVKGYPAALYGRKPGYAGYTASLLHSTGLASPNGSATAGLFPLKLPVTPVKAHVAFQHNSQPTGQGQLTFDLWLQSDARQDNGWLRSSITHEIMIPLALWGNYGAHNTPGGRNPGWYDHDATIAGKLYHVYITKDGDGCSRYNFGSLSGAYGKTGWKLIAFVPAELPVAPGEIDLAAIVNHVATRKDACGEPWARGDEYLVSAELGVEPVLGTGDITVYDYKLSNTGVTATGTTVVVPARPLGGGGNAGNGGGGNAGNGGNGGNGGNAGHGGNDGGGNDDDAKKGKDKYHKVEKDGGRFDKNGNKARPVTAKPRSESTEGTAPAGSTATPPAESTAAPAPSAGDTATPPAASTPPAAGATLPPPVGATVPPAAGSVVPPPTGATLPPPTGAMLPPAAGATVPPPAGAALPPATGATPPPATEATPAPASSATAPPATSTPAPAAATTEPAPAATTEPAASAAPVPVAAEPAPTGSTAPPSTGATVVPPAAPTPVTTTSSGRPTDERKKANPRNPRASSPPADS
jgi:hypothetical protein